MNWAQIPALLDWEAIVSLAMMGAIGAFSALYFVGNALEYFND